VIHSVEDHMPQCGDGPPAHVAVGPPQRGSSPEALARLDSGLETPAPQCGNSPETQASVDSTLGTVSSLEDRDQRAHQGAADALAAVKQPWQQAGNAPPRVAVLPEHPKVLAIEFRRYFQAQSALIGWSIHRSWVQDAYPFFCRAHGVIAPPPYKDFAKQLALLMPRARRDLRRSRDVRRKGKEPATGTFYSVLDPAAAVVVLEGERRKRA
jgi:hypothetical protein